MFRAETASFSRQPGNDVMLKKKTGFFRSTPLFSAPFAYSLVTGVLSPRINRRERRPNE